MRKVRHGRNQMIGDLGQAALGQLPSKNEGMERRRSMGGETPEGVIEVLRGPAESHGHHGRAFRAHGAPAAPGCWKTVCFPGTKAAPMPSPGHQCPCG